MYVIIDSSVNNKTKVGVGAYMINNEIKHIVFKDTSSTDCELQTAKYVLELLKGQSFILYTDCNRLCTLKTTDKEKLKRHRKWNLYKILLELLEEVTVIKVKGHKKNKEGIDIEFSKVDTYACIMYL